MSIRALKLTLCVLALMPVVGCVSTGMDMDEWSQPARAPELDQLQPLVGKWKVDYEMKAAGSDEVMKGTGTNEITWGIGNRYLIENTTMSMGPDKPGTGMGLWTWDPKAKRFKTWWFDDWSMLGSGTVKYCPDCRGYCFKGKGYNMEMGMSTVGEGCMRFVDDNTMKWCWKERIPWTPFVIMEMCGTSVRQ